MAPQYQEGDYIVDASWANMQLKSGMVVVVLHPIYEKIVKRILKVDEVGKILLIGDNVSSVSPQQLGWVERKCLLGKVIFHFPKN